MPARASAADAARSAHETLSGSPKSNSPSRAGTSGDSASRTPSPNKAVTATATATSALRPPRRRASGDRDRGREQAARGAEDERRPGERRDHQPGKRRVGDRLGRVALPV